MEQLSEAGTELAVEDGTADLEQEIGAVAGPAHLLRFVHAAVDQEVGGAFGQRGADAEPGTMAFGVVDQPSALAGQIAVDLESIKIRGVTWPALRKAGRLELVSH